MTPKRADETSRVGPSSGDWNSQIPQPEASHSPASRIGLRPSAPHSGLLATLASAPWLMSPSSYS